MPAGARAGTDRDCSDFSSQAEAQSFFISAGGPSSDPHRLDGDGDGIACESNPCPCSTTPTPSGPPGVRVVRAVDGDTILVSIQVPNQSPVEERIRLIGIDAPESVAEGTPVECGAKEASAAMARMARPGDEVALIADSSQGDRDVYGRLLRYVEEAGTDYGREMIRSGWAKIYETETPFKRLRAYSKARREAKRRHRGTWGKCGGDFHSSG